MNAHLKVPCLIAAMTGGADSFDDTGVPRHGAMGTLFGGVLGSHLCSCTRGNVHQMEMAAQEFLARPAEEATVLPGPDVLAFIDIDSMQKRARRRKGLDAEKGSTQKRVHGLAKQWAGFGHTKIYRNRCSSGT
jgi:hypothetical protein